MPRLITVNFTSVSITPYQYGDAPHIEKKHTIFDRVYYTTYPKGMYLDGNTLYLPRGIDIDRLAWALGEQPVIQVVNKPDPYSKMDRMLNIRYAPRDEKQRNAIKFIMGMDPYAFTGAHSMLSINLNTGVGKTYCAVASIALMGLRTIVITDSVNCLEQWYLYLQEYTDIKPDEICWITPQNIKRVAASNKKYSVYLAIHSTLRAYAKSNPFGWKGITDFFHGMQVGLKIYDESHLDFDNMFLLDCYTNTMKNLYLTATPNRSDFIEDKIFAEYFRGVPYINLYEKEDAHTMYAAYKIHSNPSPMQISACMGPYGLNKINYTKYLIEQPQFHYLLHVLVKQAMSKEGKSLWYIGTNDGIRYVQDWLYLNYPELYNQVGLFYGDTPKKDRRAETEKKIILSNTKSAGAAVDISGLVETVMLAEPIKSRVLAQQTFGRTRDSNTVYKDVVDTAFAQLRKYYNFKKPVFKKYATECKEVNIPNKELEKRARDILIARRSLYTPFFVPDTREGHAGQWIGKYRYPFTPADITMEQLEYENVNPT